LKTTPKKKTLGGRGENTNLEPKKEGSKSVRNGQRAWMKKRPQWGGKCGVDAGWEQVIRKKMRH